MPVPENAETIWKYLTAAGISANGAAGILGNIEQESGGNPAAGVWPSNYGLIQWTPASAYFTSPPSLDQQLPAIIGYINANGSIGDINANASSPTAAADHFCWTYERPNAALANIANREQSAVEVAQAAASGSWPKGSQTTTGGTPAVQNTFPTQGVVDAIEADDWSTFLGWGSQTMHQRAHNGYLWSQIALANAEHLSTFTTTGGK